MYHYTVYMSIHAGKHYKALFYFFFFSPAVGKFVGVTLDKIMESQFYFFLFLIKSGSKIHSMLTPN